MEYNLVAIWLNPKKSRLIAGVLGGLLAAAVSMGVAMLIAQMAGYEFWFPIKLMATAILGPAATEIGLHVDNILVGSLVVASIAIFWGVIFAHFTGTNSLKALLAMGLVWGIFSWIFLWNLFLQSFKPIFAARISSAAAFPVCIAYGLSLATVAIFDSALSSRPART